MGCISKEEKQALVKEFGKTPKDSGSAEVQIAILTAEINKLNSHLEIHPKDGHSRRGLLKKVGHRRNLLQYLKDRNLDSYKVVINKLNLRK